MYALPGVSKPRTSMRHPPSDMIVEADWLLDGQREPAQTEFLGWSV